MSYIVSPEKRSRMMEGIRGKNTKPELLIRKVLHARGFRYRLHGRKLRGKPDMSFPKYSAIIFVHGCFWHRHDCRLFKWPESNQTFWRDKITANATRDKKHYQDLTDCGWRILTVWECALKGKKNQEIRKVINSISHWLLSKNNNCEISQGTFNDN